jgi:hypothetical protein
MERFWELLYFIVANAVFYEKCCADKYVLLLTFIGFGQSILKPLKVHLIIINFADF